MPATQEQSLSARPRLPWPPLGAARGAGFGAAFGLAGGLLVGAICGVLLGEITLDGPSDKGLALTLALGLYGALVGGIHTALWHRVGKARVVGPDLRGADLRGADLQGADLSGADLTGADLAWARLDGAILAGAKLVRADLRAADLRNADLTGADLNLAILPDGTIYRPQPPRLPLRFKLLYAGQIALLLMLMAQTIFTAVWLYLVAPFPVTLGKAVAICLFATVVVYPPVGLGVCHLHRGIFRQWQRGCPNCRSPLPDWRRMRTRKQRLWGFWNCAECGAVFNAAGKMRDAPMSVD
jgi:uncharacterized membrane protein YeaQ/YmgE (transglycosylase-associated protein family)